MTGVVALGLGGAAGYRLKAGQVQRQAVAQQMSCQQEINQNEMQTVVSLLATMEQKYEIGEIGLPQVQQIAKELLPGLAFGPNNKYGFWLETKEGMVILPMKMRNPGNMVYEKWGWRVGTGLKDLGK